MKAFQAYAKNSCVTRSTPKEAAVAFFEQNPSKRKCNVTEGVMEGNFFIVQFGRASEGKSPKRWTDVTKKAAQDLPETAT